MLLRRRDPIGPRWLRSAADLSCRSIVCAILFALSGLTSSSLTSSSLAVADEKATQPTFDPGVLVGQVVLGDGKPVADAKVLLRGRTHRGARSDKEGRFRFEPLSPGHYSILAIKGSLVSRPQEFDGQQLAGFKTGKFATLRLVMRPGKELTVIVAAAATGRPLEGVLVELWTADSQHKKTGKDGTATLERLMPANYRLGIKAAGYAAVVRDVDLGASDDRTILSVSLAPGGVIRGKVADEKGRGLGGVSLFFAEEGQSTGLPGGSAETDSAGAFRRDFLPLNATIEAWISKEGYLPQRHKCTLSPGRIDAELKITLLPRPRGGSIAGIVTDEKGQPIAGARIENHGNGFDDKQIATTDRRGRYVLDNMLESGSAYEIMVRAPGRAPRRQTVKPGPAGKPAQVDVRLEPGHFLHGRVVGESGKPVAGATVGLEGGIWPLAGPVQTDETGRFELDSLPAQPRFYIFKPGYSSLSNLSLRLDSPGSATIVMQPMGVIRGRVIDAKSGKPLNHFSVWVNFSRERHRSDVEGTFNSELGYPGRQFESKDGSFTLKDLMNRVPLEVDVVAEGYQKTVLPRVVVTTADEAKVAEIALARIDSDKLATFSGRILDHAGRPVPDASLRLIISTRPAQGPQDNDFNWLIIKSGDLKTAGRCDQFLQCVSDSQGHFEFKNVLPGKHWQLAYWGEHVPQGRLPGSETTRSGESTTLTVTLPEPARIEGTIDRAKYADAGTVCVTQRGTPWPTCESRLADRQTKFEFHDLPPGEYVVSIRSKPVRSPKREDMFTWHTLTHERVDLKPGETRDVSF